ncbi:MAG: DUF3592 domain-containing protein [Ruminococcus sp.]|nr:DUF3592 domain-containing protein [Ruminococcus sp.]
MTMIIFGIIFFAGGMVAVFYFGTRQSALEKRCTEMTKGIVIDIYSTGSGDDIVYHTTVEYEMDGQTVTKKLDNSLSASKGETVQVWYDPDDHSVIYIKGLNNSSFSIRLVGSLIALSGLGLLTSAIIQWRRAKGRHFRENT